MKVLANDGISKSGADKLIKNGFDIITVSVEQGQLINYINKNDVVVLLVRSATKVRKDIIDSCPGLKIIGRGGVGRIGQEVAKIAIGIGMDVIYYDLHNDKVSIELKFFDNKKIDFNLEKSSFKDVLSKSDFITLHVPAQKEYVIGEKEFDLMKTDAGIINASRGGVIDEVALNKNINEGKISFAALDTFENEPKPEITLLMNPKISLTPHIGAATNEAQDRIGVELADQITEILK